MSNHPWWFDGTYVGALLPMPPRWLAKKLTGLWIKYVWRRFIPERLYVLCKVLTLLFGPDYKHAHDVVRSVARNPASRNLKYWAETDRALTRDPHIAENFWRGAKATFELAAKTPSLPRYEQQTLLELAYLALRARRR